MMVTAKWQLYFNKQTVQYTIYFMYFYQRPQDVDGEQGNGEGYKAHSLQPAPQLKMVLSTPQTQPAWNGCQGRDKQETNHVTE